MTVYPAAISELGRGELFSPQNRIRPTYSWSFLLFFSLIRVILFLWKVLFQTEGYLHVGSFFSISTGSSGAESLLPDPSFSTWHGKWNILPGMKSRLTRDSFASACVVGGAGSKSRCLTQPHVEVSKNSATTCQSLRVCQDDVLMWVIPGNIVPTLPVVLWCTILYPQLCFQRSFLRNRRDIS